MRRNHDDLNMGKGVWKYIKHIENLFSALAGVAQWIEHWPVKQKAAGSIPSEGTCLGCRPGPQWWVHERQPHIDVSLPLFLPPTPSLKINK